MTGKRIDIHTTIDADLYKILTDGIEARKWHNLSHAIEYCIQHSTKFSRTGKQ